MRTNNRGLPPRLRRQPARRAATMTTATRMRSALAVAAMTVALSACEGDTGVGAGRLQLCGIGEGPRHAKTEIEYGGFYVDEAMAGIARAGREPGLAARSATVDQHVSLVGNVGSGPRRTGHTLGSTPFARLMPDVRTSRSPLRSGRSPMAFSERLEQARSRALR